MGGFGELRRDVIGAVVGASLSWLAGDSLWWGIAGGIGGVVAVEIVVWVLRFVWVAPKEMYFEQQRLIETIEEKYTKTLESKCSQRQCREIAERLSDLQADYKVFQTPKGYGNNTAPEALKALDDRATAYLMSVPDLGKPYVRLLFTGAGTNPVIPLGISGRRKDVWCKAHTRVFRLNEFIREFLTRATR